MLERYEFATKEMNLTNRDLIEYPEIFQTRLFLLKQRHGFLKSLGKAQYDRTLDLYVSPREMVICSDANFAVDVAKSTPRKFDEFLRTL